MAITTRMWRGLCTAIEREDLLADPRFETGRKRAAEADTLFEEIAKWTREHTKREAMRIIAGAGVPCSAVLDTRDLLADPHLRARDFVKTVEHPEHGPIELLGWPARMSESAVPVRFAPLLGEHTAEVVAEDLGIARDEIEALCAAGAIALRDAGVATWKGKGTHG
jgi:crotonobetainyl-CoA:carnitine CoA-transferase CaiB-like acyl-CoA transferase